MGENSAEQRPAFVRKTLERDWGEIIAGDSYASPYSRKLHNDLAEKAGIQNGSESPLALRNAEIQGIGMVDQQPRLIL